MMTINSVSSSVLLIMRHYLHASDAMDDNELGYSLYFPHYLLVGKKLDCWQSRDQYLSDFRGRAGDNWARTAWKLITVQTECFNKVNLAV